jgi:glycosyltransferase involved in cell wall biosynthesis
MESISITPLVSIITVVYNGEKYIEETIKSIIAQSYTKIEFVLIDGGSTDNTINIIKKYTDHISYWITEKDQGISDAFNKGIRQASGEIIAILNADDWYEEDAIALIVKEFTELNCDIVCSKIRLFNNEVNYKVKSSSLQGIRQNMTIWHPGMFCKRKVYEKIGVYNTEIQILMDYEFILRVLAKNLNLHFSSHITTNMRFGGVSNKLIYKSMIELLKIKNDFYGTKLIHYIESAYLYCYYTMIVSAKKIIYRKW